ncbi:MAG: hypothetical protein H6959_09740 [Chromatiaceae bacterium]|nr:hypothetical protein [Gammaproteobacteria bacterium]MCP5298273.1 hypothetical protein [Chromatiaceae bacterium]MCP5423187.1 hypothetical protein [Chromatiaceae bacterium]
MDHLIAHRGEPEHWPENSLAGFRAVLAAGSPYVETDIQFSADGVPVLCHDESLLRATGRDIQIAATPLVEIQAIPAGEPGRFGDRFGDERIPTLNEFGNLLAQWPAVRAFVELKAAGIGAIGVEAAVTATTTALGPHAGQCIVISFDYPVLEHVRNRHPLPIGWVLPEWSDANRTLADRLAPEYLFVDHRRVPSTPQPLWPGPWRWVAYTVNARDEIERLLARGFDLVETNDIRRLMPATHAPA